VARYGGEAVRAAARDLIEYAERRTRAGAGRRSPPRTSAQPIGFEGDGVDDVDLPIAVRVDIRDGVFHADFAGTASRGAQAT